MENTIKKNLIFMQYFWYSKAHDSNDLRAEDEWTPYDIWINNFIEEKYLNNITSFDIEIGNELFTFDLIQNCAYLKAQPDRRRSIIRAFKNHKNRVVRKNRFSSLITKNKPFENDKDEYNHQKREKVCGLFGHLGSDNSFIFYPENNLFSSEICIPRLINNDLENHFYNKIRFNDYEEVMNFIKKEIRDESERLIMLDKSKEVDYTNLAEIYCKYLDEMEDFTFEEKIVFLYTLEGFLANSINDQLKDLESFNSKLFLYYILLQASISIVSKKYNKMHASNCTQNVDGQDYYVLYRGAIISENLILEEKELTDMNKAYKLYDEFLSTSYDETIAMSFISSDDLKQGEVAVKYKYLVKKEIADQIPNLMCFLEDISNHSNEKEVLLSSSTIFKIQNITKHGFFYEVTLIFLSNGYNDFDFIKYTSKTSTETLKVLVDAELEAESAKEIGEALNINSSIKHFSLYLANGQLPAEVAKALFEALKNNTSLKNIYLGYNKLGAEGIKAIVESLKKKTSIKNIDLRSNELGDEGAKAIADALKTYTTLEEMHLSDNQIGDKGAKAIGEALKTNTSLKNLDLTGNQLGAEGAIAIFEALKTNSTLEEINLANNQIGDKGAKAIGEALKTNTSLKIINLAGNNELNEGVKAIFETLMTNTSLKIIDLARNDLTEEVAKAIGEALKTNTSLKNINLAGNNELTDEGVKAIFEALKINTTLEEINLDNCELRDEAATAIAEALKTNCFLKEIHMNDNLIMAEGTNAISDAIRINTTFEVIHLGGNCLESEGAKAIAEALKTNSSLKNIDLYNNQLGDEGYKAISEALKINTTLKQIMLTYNQIGTEGAKAIAEALKANTSLENIYLADNQLGAEDAKFIAEALKTNSSLQLFDLSGNNLGDEGAEAIADAFKSNTSLKYICLFDNNIGDEKAEAIAAALKSNTTLKRCELNSSQLAIEVLNMLNDANNFRKIRY